jgi:two-component system sensor histidine kinase UhpB
VTDSHQTRRTLLLQRTGPILVAAGYYLGAQIGFALQSPNTPHSVLWLPNSILLAILLIVPYREWPFYLIAAFPAQMLVGWQSNAPALTMSLLFVTNCADAALGAALVRRFSSGAGPFRFDSLRSTVIFVLLGATLAPFLLSFADAGVSVATGWAADFVTAFFTRVRSNTLTHLIVVPALIETLAVEWRTLRPVRVIEAVLLFCVLTIVSAVTFVRPTGTGALPVLLYAPLPMLLWAVFRFGAGGTGWSVLVVAILASWNALHGRGPFTSSSPTDDVLSIQLFLLAVSVPLLLLSAAMQDRRRTTSALSTNEAALRRSYARVQELAGKLIAAQELERTRIARDMHDDVNQQLAAMSITVSGLRSGLPPGTAELARSLTALQDRMIALSDQVRQLSHDLHPGTLEHVGLVPALRAHCAEVIQHQRLPLDFFADPDLGPIPRDVAICVYRIVQEALRNVVDHADANSASVRLMRSPDGIELTVTDHGFGFDPTAAQARGGLGLLSMNERARLAGGRLSIVSKPGGGGTVLKVQLPLVRSSRPAASVERG